MVYAVMVKIEPDNFLRIRTLILSLSNFGSFSQLAPRPVKKLSGISQIFK